MKRILLSQLLIVLYFVAPSSAQQFAKQPQFQPTGGFPSSAPGAITGRIPEQPKPCRVYLDICERSCEERGAMARFTCLGADNDTFNKTRYNCQCFDDLGIAGK